MIMRTRKEIEGEARDSSLHDDNELILEVLLDLRELSERDRIAFSARHGQSYDWVEEDKMRTAKQLQDRIDYLENHIRILEKHLKEKQIVIDIVRDEAKDYREFYDHVKDLTVNTLIT